jgi:hypothetical protein
MAESSEKCFIFKLTTSPALLKVYSFDSYVAFAASRTLF